MTKYKIEEFDKWLLRRGRTLSLKSEWGKKFEIIGEDIYFEGSKLEEKNETAKFFREWKAEVDKEAEREREREQIWNYD